LEAAGFSIYADRIMDLRRVIMILIALLLPCELKSHREFRLPMKKSGSRRFINQDKIVNLSPRTERNFESGFTDRDYERIEAELSDIYDRLKIILEKLVYSDATEYFRLAKIIDHAIDELREKVSINSKTGFEALPLIRNQMKHAEPNEEVLEVSWKTLSNLESGLLDLLDEANEVKDSGRRSSFCSIEYFSKYFADRLSDMVGPWHDDIHPKLKSIEAIDLAKDTIMAALPPCRNCKKHSQE